MADSAMANPNQSDGENLKQNKGAPSGVFASVTMLSSPTHVTVSQSRAGRDLVNLLGEMCPGKETV
jgi:hypothetical protein